MPQQALKARESGHRNDAGERASYAADRPFTPAPQRAWGTAEHFVRTKR